MTTLPLIIYHDHCIDGFAAAWVAHAYFRGEIEVMAFNYKEPPPPVSDRDIFILDFSFPRTQLEALAEANNVTVVLDHHKTAAMDLALLPAPAPVEDWEARSRKPIPRLAASFDMARSGCGLAWDYFFPARPRPQLINYIEDRDLWLFKDPDTRAVHAALLSYPFDFAVWHSLVARASQLNDLLGLIKEGQTLDRRHLQICREIIEQTCRIMIIGGHSVPVCNAPYAFASDIGNILCKGQPFAATYVDHASGRTFSLRSTSVGEDVSLVAQKYGGGGHRNASGFTTVRGWESDADSF